MKGVGFSNVIVAVLLVLGCAFAFEFKQKVIVTGAAGRTGSLVFNKLLSSPDKFSPLAIVRSQNSIRKLLKYNGVDVGKNVVVSDVTNFEELVKQFKEADSVILCTSAVPKIKVLSLIKTLILKIAGKSARPAFYFIPNGDPYNVDWLGAKNQIDAAKEAGVKHFVFLSSMGGTQPENFLNSIGKIEGEENSGNILLWKRKAEEYLVASGMNYTIVHPGGLIDKPGGKSEIIAGVNDELLSGSIRQISRADVAEVCTQALLQPAAANKALDIVAQPSEDDKDVETDWSHFFELKDTYRY